MTPAERQAKCRAIKRGTWHTYEGTPSAGTLLLGRNSPSLALPSPQKQTPALAGPVRSSAAALPAPAPISSSTAIQEAGSSGASPDASKLALLDTDGDGAGAALQLSLPPAVAARLRSLLERHDSGMGKPLTAAERAEAQGLLDIAEFFVVQRLRRRLAA